MRIYIKGGVWKNSEDEVLKAAVMKYGKNQWSRISSLLVRKSAKQCKARWYEWLDPSIKKTEWTQEEDEKLLHLAKLMPTQWRTIAPIVGRTASQCLERYERLLDEAQGRDPDSIDPADDPRRLRPGEIDPNPEAKPARPDPIDMDEDEKEMLSEARARLANTKGKKAKRKAREKQLEEARRLASLQKRRELKAAGIVVPKRRRRRDQGIDYENEVPFEKTPAIGFYATPDSERPAPGMPDFKNLTLEKLDGKKRAHVEEDARKADAKRKKKNKEKDPAAAIMAVAQLNDASAFRRRSRLALSAPQMTDADLEEIVRLGFNVDGESEGGSAATEALLADYATPAATPMRTPRAEAGTDYVMKEARDLITLTNAQTPLVGGENAPLLSDDFAGVTPARQVAATPNAHMTPSRAAGGGVGGFGGLTPGRGVGSQTAGQTPGMTPARDSFGINAPDDEPGRAASQRKQLKSLLSALPKPTNDNFEIGMPALDDDDDAQAADQALEQDAGEVAAERAKAAAAREKERLERRSVALKRGLPRPLAVPGETVAKATDDAAAAVAEYEKLSESGSSKRKGKKAASTVDKSLHSAASAMVKAEMFALLQADATNYPLVGQPPKRPRGPAALPATLLAEAHDLLRAETAVLTSAAGFDPLADLDTFAELSLSTDKELLYVPTDASVFPKLARRSVASLGEKIAATQAELQANQEAVAADQVKAAKLTKRVTKLTKGYEMRADKLKRDLASLSDRIEEATRNYKCYQALATLEKNNTPTRVETLKTAVATMKMTEKDLQTKYAALTSEKEELSGRANGKP